MAKRPTDIPHWLSWRGMIYYGETVGFVAAWVAGIAALAGWSSTDERAQPSVDQVAAVDRPER